MMNQFETQSQSTYALELRALQKHFRNLDKQQVRIILEFCEFDISVAYKVLMVMANSQKNGIMKQLIEKPENSDEIVNATIERFNNSQFASVEMPVAILNLIKSPTKLNKEKKIIMPFFEKLPAWLLFDVLKFLKPLEIAAFIKLQPSIEQAYLGATHKKEQYYKSICQVLFPSAVPTLPYPSIFLPLKQYILTHPLEFNPNIKHAAQTNFQDLIWHCHPNQFTVDKEYYINSFGSFENIYHQAHRLNYNGYYVLREKYMRRGDYSLDTPGVPFYLVEYYKYVRFIVGGAIVYKLSNKKLKDDELAYELSLDRLKQQNQTIIKGEYLQYKDHVYFRFARTTSVFFYECQIDTRKQLFDTLTVDRFALQLIDPTMLTQELYVRKPHQENRFFAYKPLQEIAKENSQQIQTCSM